MSMPRAVRHINETRVLDVLFRSGPTSRASLARELGLTRSTTSSIVADLVRDGVVLENQGEPADKGVRTGRPSIDVRLNPRHAVFLGADIGVGISTVVAIDLTAHVVRRAAKPVDVVRASPDTIADELVSLIRSVVSELPTSRPVRGVTIAVPGLLDRAGNVLRAPFLRWSNVPILQMLRARLSELDTIEVENDANAFAMAEMYHEGKLVPSNALYVLLEAGVGGAIVSEGKLLRGHDGYAGEIGHIFVGDGGFASDPILPGSLESFVGRDAILDRYRFHGGSAKTVDQFLHDIEQSAPSAIATLDEWSYYLSRGLAMLVSTLNPQKIVIGGSIAALVGYAKHNVQMSMLRHLLPKHPIPAVELSTLGSDAAAIGAASMLHQNMFSFDEGLVFNGIAG